MRLAFAAVLLVACGGGDKVDLNATADTFCDTLAAVSCHNIFQCCTESTIERDLGVSDPRTEEQCRTDVARACNTAMTSSIDVIGLHDSIKAGRVTFDAQKYNDCLGVLLAPDGTCSEVLTDDPTKMSCAMSAFVGTVATGGACVFNLDCQGSPDSFCGPNQKCQAKPTAGFPCGQGCASAFYCDNGTCQAKLAVGGPCMSTSQCQKDLFCDLDATPMPICTATKAGGEPCTSNLACKSDRCIPGQCMGTTNTCYKSTDCSAHCANSNLFCTTAANCGTGNCSVGGNMCSSDTNCVAGGTDHCVFPVQCVPGTCVGDPPVCTTEEIEIDFCDVFITVPPVVP